MNNTIKKLRISVFLCVFSVFLSVTATARDSIIIRNEFSINFGAGASSFQSNPVQGKDFIDWSGTFGFSNYFFFGSRLGAGFGINLVIYNGGITIDDYSSTQATTNTVTGNPFDFLVNSNFYRETHQAVLLSVPLMIKYRGSGFYFAFGGKAGFPVFTSSRSEGRFSSRGYFPNLNVTFEDLPHLGFVSNKAFPNVDVDFDMKTVLILSVELGKRWRLGTKSSLYTGIYVDLDVTKQPLAASDDNLVVYRPRNPANLVYNSAINTYAQQISPVSGGITLRLAFGRL